MRRTRAISLAISTLVFLLLCGRSMFALADTANAPSLIISQLKITSSNGQFITLYNATDTTLDMSKYQLEYFNNYDLTKATSSRLIGLSGTVPPHGYYMINDSSLLLCYQLTIDSQALGLSSTAGMIQVMSHSQLSPGGGVMQVLQDYAGWAKSAATGAITLPANTSAFLQRQPTDARNNPAVTMPGVGSWLSVQNDPTNPCKLITTVSSPTQVATGLNQLLPSSEPPATIVSVAFDDSGVAPPSLPAGDIGLMAPQVTELLPNPDGTGNDSTDEYIELYNPNASTFDLSGFSLQSGLTTPHIYKFPQGSTLGAKSFKAFYAEQTSLSLSNTSSQVKLLDPFGNSISASVIYSSAKDGQAWALAKGKWYWTTALTPSLANVIKQPPLSKKTKSSTGTKSSNTSKTNSSKASVGQGSSYPSDEPVKNPVHIWTLALIGSLGILYVLYEYRSDLGNRIHQLRGYIKNRGVGRPETKGW